MDKYFFPFLLILKEKRKNPPNNQKTGTHSPDYSKFPTRALIILIVDIILSIDP